MNLNSNWLSYSKWEDRVTCFISSIWFIENYMKREFVISFFMCVSFILLHTYEFTRETTCLLSIAKNVFFFQLSEILKVTRKKVEKLRPALNYKLPFIFSQFQCLKRWTFSSYCIIHEIDDDDSVILDMETNKCVEFFGWSHKGGDVKNLFCNKY